MLIRSPDIETVLPGKLRAILEAAPFAWNVTVGRNRGTGTLAVSVQRAGGAVDGVTDEARLLVNVYAPTDAQANDLANDVVAALGSIRGTSPIMRIVASGPSAVSNEREKQRFISASAMVRRVTV